MSDSFELGGEKKTKGAALTFVSPPQFPSFSGIWLISTYFGSERPAYYIYVFIFHTTH